MSDAYTYSLNFKDGDTSPDAPDGVAITGGSPLSWDSGGVVPAAPCGDADHVGAFTGMPDSSGDTMPKPPIVDGATMPINLGKTTGSL